jgi:methionine-rich copper-binding protein CopC
VDPRDNTQLVLPLPVLAPGRYEVMWHVVSVDTHRTEDTYDFEVKP